MKKNRTDNFDKFSLKKKGSAVKENIRQDKKKAKAESRAMGEAARQRKIDKARGIVTDPPKEKYAKGPYAKKTTGYEKKPSTRKSFPDAPAKYGELTPSHTTRPTTARPAATNKRTPASMDKADEKRTASIGKVNAAADTPYEQMPLNKYIAHAGISGRREAAAMVKSGHVTINGDTILEPGYKVQYKDVVRLKGKVLQLQVTPVYILLNKPKDYICTANDPEGRKTVLDIIKNATTQRMFPVGRLDRNTTGVLILTNDGDLAQKLTHPSYEIKKIYEVTLDKPVTKADMEAIAKGLELEDGFIAADAVSYLSNTSKDVIGIEIHSGRNRIVRRIFEHLGYDVRHLDRVMFANLTKKNVDRGKWRFLAEKEVRLLKFMNKSFTRKSAKEN
ncbi:MAG: pseudouridine synthase [Bacteroidetes bacterium]|jgi:23S rRNA pseudouridine2605 synthase|nr:pseudouridine synthase [Bacteroidota bacterium]